MTKQARAVSRALLGTCLAAALVSAAPAVLAQESAAPAAPAASAAQTKAEVKIGFLRTYERTLALSALDIPPEDIGLAGAKVAIDDNNTTGSFMGQNFTMDVVTLKPGEDVAAAALLLLGAALTRFGASSYVPTAGGVRHGLALLECGAQGSAFW